MNVLRIDSGQMFLNVFPRKVAPYYLHYPHSDPTPFSGGSKVTRTYYRNRIVMAKDSQLIDTTASTWDEARQLHPELFI